MILINQLSLSHNFDVKVEGIRIVIRTADASIEIDKKDADKLHQLLGFALQDMEEEIGRNTR